MTHAAPTSALAVGALEDVSATERGCVTPGGMPYAVVTAEELPSSARALLDHGFGHLALVTAVERVPLAEEAGSDSTASSVDEPGLDLIYVLTRRSDSARVMLRVRLVDSDLAVPSLTPLWSGAHALEREVYDLFGVMFVGHPDLKRIVLRDDFEGHPLRKSFAMGEHGVTAEQVAEAVKDHGDKNNRPAEHSPLIEGRLPGDPLLHSERLILNVGPQHPSTHGVLHVWLALDGENVVASEPTHGYLHRCIEKLAESRNYRANIALLDRCDYVSGFHTELAYMLALEELAGVESTPKADFIRVLMSELVRITSHHTWLAACGLDTGALTPFLYAFIDREKILDFFEIVTGGRMMFNYFRPGGVKDDLPPGAAEDLRRYLLTFEKQVDEYESLLTANEIFRYRVRGVGVLPPSTIESYGVTGPLARASGVDIDLRRDDPYSAYDRFKVNVPIAQAGDTFDRYVVRIAEMRESARLALACLDGMPEGPYLNPDVPRILRPPVGEAYREVESPRGELGVYLASDGSAQPWRLKVRSPALSNLHVAPEMLRGTKLGDVVAVLGSVDVVMGEIDR